MYFIDTHAHLFLEEFDADRKDVIERSIHQGIKKMILPNVDYKTLNPMLDTVDINQDALFPAIGVHPCSIKEGYKEELKLIKEALNKRKYKAIGEIGLDLYWDKTFYTEQIEALEEQINWASELNLPVILHCRETLDQTIELVQKYKNLKGVFHAFTGNENQAKQIVDMGFYIGIGGVVTFKNSGLDKVAPSIPLQNIVLETDSPYLTPTPFRGKRNEPIYVKLVAEKLATLHNVHIEEVTIITSKNAEKLFNI